MPDEIEWQLEAQDLRLVLRWLESAGTNGVTVGHGPTVNQLDTYLDTEDRRLDRAGYSVRVRRPRTGPTEATLKSLDPVGAGGLRVRLELAEELDGDDPSAVAQAPGAVGRRVRALVGPRPLVPLFDVQTRRRVFPLTSDGASSGELLLDETSIRDHADGRILSRLRRVEVEVPESGVAGVAPFVETMQRTLGLQPAVLSKYEAALVATGNGRAAQQSFGPTSFATGDAIGQVALASLRKHLSAMLAHEPGTRLGDDPEELHAMRVAVRRMRAALTTFAAFLPADAGRIRPELAWLGETVGAVRDLDVQIERLGGDPGLGALRTTLAADREAAREAMLAALDSQRYDRLVRRLGTVLRTRTGTRTPAATAVAPDLIERRHRALRKAYATARRTGDAAEYHRMRIAGKRFRYALEFTAGLYDGQADALIKRTTALQDVLGSYQDANVAVEYLHRLATERGGELGADAVFAMGALAERDRGAAGALRKRVPSAFDAVEGRAWKRFRRRLEAARPPITPIG